MTTTNFVPRVSQDTVDALVDFIPSLDNGTLEWLANHTFGALNRITQNGELSDEDAFDALSCQRVLFKIREEISDRLVHGKW